MKHFKNNFLFFEILLFLFCQILGILVARKFQISGTAPQVFPEDSFLSFVFFIFIFGLSTVIFFFLILFLRRPKIFLKVIFSLTAFLGTQISLGAFLPNFLVYPLTILFVLFWYIFSNVFWHNFLIILTTSGIGSFLGVSLKPETVLLIFIFLSIYDIIAVYKTKHMIRAIKPMIDSKVVFGIIVPQKAKNFLFPLKDIKIGDQKEKFFLLGSGDLILPTMLSASFASTNLLKSVVIIFFTLLGLTMGFFVFLKLEKRSMPALPPLALGGVLGYLFAKFL